MAVLWYFDPDEWATGLTGPQLESNPYNAFDVWQSDNSVLSEFRALGARADIIDTDAPSGFSKSLHIAMPQAAYDAFAAQHGSQLKMEFQRNNGWSAPYGSVVHFDMWAKLTNYTHHSNGFRWMDTTSGGGENRLSQQENSSEDNGAGPAGSPSMNVEQVAEFRMSNLPNNNLLLTPYTFPLGEWRKVWMRFKVGRYTGAPYPFLPFNPSDSEHVGDVAWCQAGYGNDVLFQCRNSSVNSVGAALNKFSAGFTVGGADSIPFDLKVGRTEINSIENGLPFDVSSPEPPGFCVGGSAMGMGVIG